MNTLNTQQVVNPEQSTSRSETVEAATRNVAALFEAATSSEVHQVPSSHSELRSVMPSNESLVTLVNESLAPSASGNGEALRQEAPIALRIQSRRQHFLNDLNGNRLAA